MCCWSRPDSTSAEDPLKNALLKSTSQSSQDSVSSHGAQWNIKKAALICSLACFGILALLTFLSYNNRFIYPGASVPRWFLTLLFGKDTLAVYKRILDKKFYDNLEEVWIKDPSSEDVIHGVYVASTEPNPITIVYCHGNAGLVKSSNGAWKVQHILSSMHPQPNLLHFDYRGYGYSSGAVSEELMAEDSKIVLDYLLKKKNIAAKDIFVYGHSLGGAFAIKLVALAQARNPPVIPGGLILASTFQDIDGVLGARFTAVGKWVFRTLRLVTAQWPSDKTIKSIKRTPILFLSSRKDKMIPKEQMDSLHKACVAEEKKFIKLLDRSHDDVYRCNCDKARNGLCTHKDNRCLWGKIRAWIQDHHKRV
eukprot:177972_1